MLTLRGYTFSVFLYNIFCLYSILNRKSKTISKCLSCTIKKMIYISPEILNERSLIWLPYNRLYRLLPFNFTYKSLTCIWSWNVYSRCLKTIIWALTLCTYNFIKFLIVVCLTSYFFDINWGQMRLILFPKNKQHFPNIFCQRQQQNINRLAVVTAM